MLKIVVAALIALVAVPAAAEEKEGKETINFSQQLIKPDKTPIQECNSSEPDPAKRCINVTLGMVTYTALNTPKQGTIIDMAARYRLQIKVFSGEKVALSKVEIASLITAINEKGFPTDYAGQAFCMLDHIYCDQ
jgi:hypothetical protein